MEINFTACLVLNWLTVVELVVVYWCYENWRILTITTKASLRLKDNAVH